MIREVIQIKYADSFLSENAIFSAGEKGKMVPIIFAFFVLKIENHVILVDAGCDSMDGFIMNNYLMPDEAVRHYGVMPHEVTDIIITHADHDHIDGVHHFKNAIIHIQEDEYARGKHYIPDTFKVELFKEDKIVAEEVKVVKIGGHQIGSCVVEFEFNNLKCVVVGDECYSDYNIKNKVPTASTCNIENSTAFIEKYAGNEYTLLLMHG